MNLEVAVYKSEKLIFRGQPCDAREKVEELIYEALGFCPSLQENEEMGVEEWIYLHTDAYEELSEDQLDQLARLRITEDGETTIEALHRLLQVSFEFIEKEDNA